MIFQVGETYWTRSIGDYECIHSFVILGRTAKTVTVKVSGKTVRRGLTVYDGCEQFKPFGSYSMCAIISADRSGRTMPRAAAIEHCRCGAVLSAVTGDCVRGVHCRM